MSSAINIEDALFMTSDGAVFPVTNWLDEEGDECPREEAVVCVAGRDLDDGSGCWFAITISEFETVPTQ